MGSSHQVIVMMRTVTVTCILTALFGLVLAESPSSSADLRQIWSIPGVDEDDVPIHNVPILTAGNCLDDYKWCYKNSDCCSQNCSNKVCLPLDITCYPDYQGPCVDSSDCCLEKSTCDNLICQPISCGIPDGEGPCYKDSDCCSENCDKTGSNSFWDWLTSESDRTCK